MEFTAEKLRINIHQAWRPAPEEIRIAKESFGSCISSALESGEFFADYQGMIDDGRAKNEEFVTRSKAFQIHVGVSELLAGPILQNSVDDILEDNLPPDTAIKSFALVYDICRGMEDVTSPITAADLPIKRKYDYLAEQIESDHPGWSTIDHRIARIEIPRVYGRTIDRYTAMLEADPAKTGLGIVEDVLNGIIRQKRYLGASFPVFVMPQLYTFGAQMGHIAYRELMNHFYQPKS